MKSLRHKRAGAAVLAAASIAGVIGMNVGSGAAHAAPTSQNGYALITQAETVQWSVNGVNFWTAPGAPTERLQAFAVWFDSAIEPLSLGDGDDWSWAEAALIPPSNITYSNHASGTAIDLNMARHLGQGASGTFTPEQAGAISAKAAELGLVWGGSWTDIPDEPHIEMPPIQ